jgi:hypothetical protein
MTIRELAKSLAKLGETRKTEKRTENEESSLAITKFSNEWNTAAIHLVEADNLPIGRRQTIICYPYRRALQEKAPGDSRTTCEWNELALSILDDQIDR